MKDAVFFERCQGNEAQDPAARAARGEAPDAVVLWMLAELWSCLDSDALSGGRRLGFREFLGRHELLNWKKG